MNTPYFVSWECTIKTWMFYDRLIFCHLEVLFLPWTWSAGVPSRQFVVAKCPPSAVSNDSLPRRAAWHCTPISVQNSYHFIPAVSCSVIFLNMFLNSFFYACPKNSSIRNWMKLKYQTVTLLGSKWAKVSTWAWHSLRRSPSRSVRLFSAELALARDIMRGRKKRSPRAKVSWLVTASFRPQDILSKCTAYSIRSLVELSACINFFANLAHLLNLRNSLYEVGFGRSDWNIRNGQPACLPGKRGATRLLFEPCKFIPWNAYPSEWVPRAIDFCPLPPCLGRPPMSLMAYICEQSRTFVHVRNLSRYLAGSLPLIPPNFLFSHLAYDLTVDGGHTLTLDELLQNYVQPCDGGSICLICGKKLLGHVRRHMQDIHLSFEGAYYCPTCDKKFKSRNNMYDHIRYKHKDWKGVNVANFEVKSKSQWIHKI